VRPELVARWESAHAAAERAGYRIVPLRDVPAAGRAALLDDLFNDAFAAHWGFTPSSAAEHAVLAAYFEASGYLDTAAVAWAGDEPAGYCMVVPEITSVAVLAPGRQLADAEKLNWLGIGIRAAHRGRGVNLAMAGRAFCELARRGARYVSYTLVLDHNWPSRRTAEKLGAFVCANYLAYRRELRR
jgi:RimJ/RimL family protein N-acetyltransferase